MPPSQNVRMTRELLIDQFDPDSITTAAYEAYVAKKKHVNMANKDSGTVRCLWYLFDMKNREPVSEPKGDDIHVRYICLSFTSKPHQTKWNTKTIDGRLLFDGSEKEMEWSGRHIPGNGKIRVSAPLSCVATGDETLETKFGKGKTTISVLVTSTESADSDETVERVDLSSKVPAGDHFKPDWQNLKGGDLEQVAKAIFESFPQLTALNSTLNFAIGKNVSEFIDTKVAYEKGMIADLIGELSARGDPILKFLNKVKSEFPQKRKLQELLKNLPTVEQSQDL